MTFTADHELQLRDHFGGVFAGRMGLKSWMGPMLEHAQSVGLHPVDLSREYMPVAPMSHEAQRANREIGADALKAVEDERRVRGALALMEAAHVRVLRLAYTPQPRGATPALAAFLLGEQRAMELTRQLGHESREVRREARRALAAGDHLAAQALDQAQTAYVAAVNAAKAAVRADRVKAFARSMGAR